ncbi:MAG: dTMP kinase [Syntrophomonas sp.]
MIKKKGIFISFEGIDGCGKSSIIESLLSYLDKYKIVSLREPGGTHISEKIREMLLDVKNEAMVPRTEAFLYAAARSQVVEEIIRPALGEGAIVLADRYLDSTLAYQGYGRGLDIQFLKELNQLCTGGLMPDLTLLLDLNPEVGKKRKKKDIPDRLEKEGISFQNKVRAGYLDLARHEPYRIKVLDAGQDFNIVLAETIKHIDALLR